jgi:hypothetical protein
LSASRIRFTDTAGDKASINFTGSQIRLYAAETGDGGQAAVSIDGGPESLVDLYSAEEAGNVLVYSSPTLTPGNHSLEVRSTGTHDPGSFGTRVHIDRFEIVPKAE